MQTVEFSVLIPVKNMENRIEDVLRFAARQTAGLSTEFIVVDMGSADKTVLQAVLLMKSLSLHGFVIQNGDSPVPAALNTAVQKSGGEYLTFLSAKKLYEGYVRQYLEAAKRFGADFIFGCTGKDEVRAAERRLISSAVCQPNGVLFAKEMLRRGSLCDLAAVFVRRDFLCSKSIAFSDTLAFGYAEEFVLRCLLCAGTVVQVPVLLARYGAERLKGEKRRAAGLCAFQRVEALLRVLEEAQNRCAGDTELLRLLEKEKIPLVVMDSVDSALRDGVGRQAVKSYLAENGFDKMLSVDRKASPDLKRRILAWKMFPFLYRP